MAPDLQRKKILERVVLPKHISLLFSSSVCACTALSNNHNAGELLTLVFIESWFASNDSGNCWHIRQPVIA
jgi:hypothetical protein